MDGCISHGVSQGSILDPLLFITHLNDLPLNVKLPYMYVFDTAIYATDDHVTSAAARPASSALLQTQGIIKSNFMNWLVVIFTYVGRILCIHLSLI